MYRCKECNAEYRVKPDYCDCGNDTFDYIEEKQPITLEQKAEIVSRVFFAICLIIAIGVWFIPMKNKPQHKSAPPVQTKTVIPDINKIWDDTPIYQPQQIIPQQVTNITTEPIILTPTPVQKKNLTPAKVVPPKKAPVTKIAVDKTLVTEQPKPIQKPVQATKPTPKPIVKPIVKTEPIVKLEPAKPVYNPNSPVMIDYKTKLRAKLFTKFAVGGIQGSGTCSISFSIDKSGKLINRKFTRESNNKSLNDTVYYMLMSVPYFTVPPAEYNGSPINMTFTINDGSYEISIK